MLIRGAKPTKLSGAQDKSFSVVAAEPACTHPDAYTPSPPTVVQGRTVAGRVVDLFKERGVPLEQLGQILKDASKTDEGDLIIYSPAPAQGVGIGWIAVENDGSVVLAGI